MKKPIEGFPGYFVTYDGLIISSKYGYDLVMKHGKTINGYNYVILRKDGKSIPKTVHRLVAIHFIENPFNLPHVLHNDNDRGNPHGDNLRWGTHKENMLQMSIEGRGSMFWKGKLGGQNKQSKKIDQFTKDGEFVKTWDSAVDVTRDIGISNANISSCIKGKLRSAGGYVWKFKKVPNL